MSKNTKTKAVEKNPELEEYLAAIDALASANKKVLSTNADYNTACNEQYAANQRVATAHQKMVAKATGNRPNNYNQY